jgi:hypothetical protein
MARTTAECKQFLVDFFTRNPQIMDALFHDPYNPPDPNEPSIQSLVTNVDN